MHLIYANCFLDFKKKLNKTWFKIHIISYMYLLYILYNEQVELYVLEIQMVLKSDFFKY